MKELFSGISKGVFFDILIFATIFYGDINTEDKSSLWVTLVLVSLLMIFTDLACRKYDYTLPVDHEWQPVHLPDIKANVVRAILAVILTLTPVMFGPFLIKVAGILVLVFSLFTFKDCWNLYLYVKSQD